METIPTTSRSLDHYYHIKGDTFEKQYKEVLSGYREWSELSHAEDWLVFPENIGESICIDETAPSNGELYTIVSNRSSRGGKGTLIAIVKGVAADVVTEALMRIDEDKRLMVKEITMDMSNSMRLIAKRCFPNAMRTIDRFHIQKLACDALQEMRIAHRWDAIQADTDAREKAKSLGEAYTPIVLANGDTHKQLLARSRYLFFKLLLSAKKFRRIKIRAGFLAWNSVLLVTFVLLNIISVTMNKGTHFNGQPIYGQLINLLDKQEISNSAVQTTENAM